MIPALTTSDLQNCKKNRIHQIPLFQQRLRGEIIKGLTLGLFP